MLYMGQAGRLLEWANCIFVTLISYLGINAERQHWPSWANVNFLSSNLRSLSSSLSSHNHHPLMFMFIFMFNEHCSCWILWSPNKIPTNALLLSNELCLLAMVEPCKGGEGKTNKQKEVTDVDFSSLPWEHLGCLKRSTEAHFWGVLAFPITHFEPFEGDLRQRERETGLNSVTCPGARREKRRPGVKSILFKAADSNFFTDWIEGSTNSL